MMSAVQAIVNSIGNAFITPPPSLRGVGVEDALKQLSTLTLSDPAAALALRSDFLGSSSPKDKGEFLRLEAHAAPETSQKAASNVYGGVKISDQTSPDYAKNLNFLNDKRVSDSEAKRYFREKFVTQDDFQAKARVTEILNNNNYFEIKRTIIPALERDGGQSPRITQVRESLSAWVGSVDAQAAQAERQLIAVAAIGPVIATTIIASPVVAALAGGGVTGAATSGAVGSVVVGATLRTAAGGENTLGTVALDGSLGAVGGAATTKLTPIVTPYINRAAAKISDTVIGKGFVDDVVVAKGIGTPADLGIPKFLNPRQSLHIPPVTDGRSVLTANAENLLQELHAEAFVILRQPKLGQVVVDFGKPIGEHWSNGVKIGDTSFGSVSYGKNGAHIIPANPKQW